MGPLIFFLSRVLFLFCYYPVKKRKLSVSKFQSRVFAIFISELTGLLITRFARADDTAILSISIFLIENEPILVFCLLYVRFA
jgi:hypothetical protein